MSKKSFRYRNQVTCPHCHQKYPTNSNYECPYCHTKFYDLSFVDLKTEDSFSIPFYVRYKCDGYTGFAEKPKEEYDVFITLKTMGIRVENNLDYSYEKFSNLHGDFYGKYLIHILVKINYIKLGPCFITIRKYDWFISSFS